jgi:hypothetical protein
LQVLQQGDAFSCGLHVLYDLKHVLKFGEVMREDSGSQISFTANMVGKRVQLVDELLKECGSSVMHLVELGEL